jgi:leucyl aminopeptidase
MTITTLRSDPLLEEVQAVVIPLSKADIHRLPRALKEFDATIGGQLSSAVAAGDITGKEYQMTMLYPAGLIPATRVLVIGIGERKDWNATGWQHVLGAAARALQAVKVTQWALMIPSAYRRKFDTATLGALTAKAIEVSTYHFADYKSSEDAKLPEPESVIVGAFSAVEARAFQRGVQEGAAIAGAINWARRLGDMPSSDATPTHLASQAKKLADTHEQLDIQVIDKAEMKKLGMGALLGVARGAATPPKFIVLEWRGGKKESDPWHVMVGKAITFDSGGISIKPSSKMDEMKFDMCGGAAVLGAMRAIAELGLKLNVVGIVPATDNMSGSGAMKPGDILTTCRGKTIEVLNTDAEGRLVLADGLGYAQRYEPKAMVNLATLTGACVVALGHHYAGLFSNNAGVRTAMERAAKASGDRSWPLPIGDAFTREVESDIADWRNLGKQDRWGGACTAAAFLEQFVEERPWAHLDIAGTAWSTTPQPWIGTGATGFGVHLLVELAKTWAR